MLQKPKLKTSALLLQSISAVSIAALTTLTGFIFAWPSYTIENFVSNGTHLESPMTTMEVSLLGSLVNIGALAVTPFCGVIVDTLGRKKSAILFGLPYLITWTIIALTRSKILVIISMAIGGIGGAGQVVSTVYISEISDDSIRGGLSSACVSGYFFGVLISYIFGGYMSYQHVIYTHLSLTIVYMGMLMLLHESPVFLVQQGKIKEAKKSLAFYKRLSVTSKEIENEINKIKLQLDPDIDRILQKVKDPEEANTLIENKMVEIVATEQNISSWRFLMKSKSSQRAMICVLSLMTLSIMMGSIVLQVYAEPLLKEAAPSIPSNLAAILLAVDFLVSSALCAAMVDRFGRRVLIFYSALASAVFSLLLAVQLQTYFAPPWVTVFIIYGYTFVYTLGAATIPFILTAEVFLPEVRGLGNSLSMGCMWIMNFVTLIIFNIMVEYFGLAEMFYIFAVVCVLCAVYSWFCLPETKGLSADAIQVLFYKND